MSYSGSTAASTLANPPLLISSGMVKTVLNNGSTINGAGKGSGAQLWLYTSTNSGTEASSGTNSGQFFADAYNLGMKNGDVVMMIGATAATTVGFTMGVVQGITSTGAGAYLSTGSMVSSTFG
jgi:hypothetical protein